ncbi:putative NIF3 family GTP cyclohydrolase 1 type 2 [Peribacillus deserti]|uniref:GTP cyclohydrolase 1 type 2 homolog n=1 Tax=Peribacillus deserti TaxID=673318 RepID=A0ABS2QGK8_9BACI|nr:putative NIF3 family GTP cyclohydrolase 1 type 2 [Peribacillus deserti]
MKLIGIDSIRQYSVYQNGEIPGIGEFNHPISFETFVQRMRNILEESARAWRHNEKEFKRIGVLTGAGHSSDLLN